MKDKILKYVILFSILMGVLYVAYINTSNSSKLSKKTIELTLKNDSLRDIIVIKDAHIKILKNQIEIGEEKMKLSIENAKKEERIRYINNKNYEVQIEHVNDIACDSSAMFLTRHYQNYQN